MTALPTRTRPPEQREPDLVVLQSLRLQKMAPERIMAEMTARQREAAYREALAQGMSLEEAKAASEAAVYSAGMMRADLATIQARLQGGAIDGEQALIKHRIAQLQLEVENLNLLERDALQEWRAGDTEDVERTQRMRGLTMDRNGVVSRQDQHAVDTVATSKRRGKDPSLLRVALECVAKRTELEREIFGLCERLHSPPAFPFDPADLGRSAEADTEVLMGMLRWVQSVEARAAGRRGDREQFKGVVDYLDRVSGAGRGQSAGAPASPEERADRAKPVSKGGGGGILNIVIAAAPVQSPESSSTQASPAQTSASGAASVTDSPPANSTSSNA